MGNLREGGGGTSCSEDDMFSRSAQESRPCIEDMPSSDGKLMSPFEKSSGGAMISISSSFPAEMVLEEVTMGLLLASEGVPRELRLTSTRLPPKLTLPSDPITCCWGCGGVTS